MWGHVFSPLITRGYITRLRCILAMRPNRESTASQRITSSVNDNLGVLRAERYPAPTATVREQQHGCKWSLSTRPLQLIPTHGGKARCDSPGQAAPRD